jgi:hypothetical protein
MRVATYTRISTDEEHQPYSLEAQASRLQSYISSQDGWLLVRSFSDQKSGATTDRPQLQQALDEARSGRFDLLLVYRVDRFSRSVRGLAQLLEELDRAGIAFRSATEPFDIATPAGRMMVQMLGVFAESNAPPSLTALSPAWNARHSAAAGTAAPSPSATSTTRSVSVALHRRRPTLTHTLGQGARTYSARGEVCGGLAAGLASNRGSQVAKARLHRSVVRIPESLPSLRGFELGAAATGG